MDNSVRDSEIARDESTHAAEDSTVRFCRTSPTRGAAARRRPRPVTVDFRDSYPSPPPADRDVGSCAKQKQISAVSTVPAVASVSANSRHAVVLVFVNQTVIVARRRADRHRVLVWRVTLDKVG